jgi:hypothetical protein
MSAEPVRGLEEVLGWMTKVMWPLPVPTGGPAVASTVIHRTPRLAIQEQPVWVVMLTVALVPAAGAEMVVGEML